MPSSRRKFMQDFSLAFAGASVMPGIISAAPPVKEKPMKHNTAEDNNLTTADIIIDKLISWKVDIIFGLVGDGVNPLFEALRKRKEEIRLITVRHEEAAAFMASGYAKFTGKLGVCIATTGPGAVHLMNGLYDAAMEDMPVLAITGVINHDLLGTQFTQEVNTVALMEDVSIYNQQITGPQHARTVTDQACRAALTTPGVAHITVATDTQQQKLQDDKPSKKAGHIKGSSAFTPRIDVPAQTEMEAAAQLINSSNKIVILAGRGGLKAKKEIQELAEKLGAPVAKALLGKAVLPDDSPLTTGGTGRLGTLPSKQMMEECELLFIVGSNMPHLEYYPKNAKAIQIDRDAKRISLRYPVDIGLHGDVKATLEALLPKLKYQNNRSFLQLAQRRMADWNQTLAKLESNQSLPIKPQYLVAQVNKLINKDALISIDTGAHTVFSARHLRIKQDQQVVVCGNLASMAPGLPYAIAGQIAYPGRQSIAMVGDGSFTMLMGEMATAVLYNLPVKVILFKNNALAMDRFEQEELGNPTYAISLQPIDFVKIAEACGAEGYSCNNPSELPGILSRAFASAKPCVIEVSVDPDEPPAAPEDIKM